MRFPGFGPAGPRKAETLREWLVDLYRALDRCYVASGAGRLDYGDFCRFTSGFAPEPPADDPPVVAVCEIPLKTRRPVATVTWEG